MAHSRRALVGWSALFVYLCILTLVASSETALHFTGPAIDGPFQLYNALRRIAVGQRPGVDFQFFHGVLIPYLHYPFFRLLGGQFFDSEMTREVVSTLLYPITVVVFLKFFIRDWTRTMAWAAIVMGASIALRMTSVLVAINSLLGIRSMLPVLFPVVLALPIRRGARTLLGALTIGGSLLLGTEQGLAAIAALLLVTVVAALRSGDRQAYVVDAGAMIGGGAATLVVVLMLLGGVDGMRGAIAYNFRTIPLDQYWYFGAPPNLFFSSWRDLPATSLVMWKIPAMILLGIAVLAFVVLRFWQSVGDSLERREYAFAVGIAYGLISCASLLGILASAYIQPLERILLLVGAVYADESLRRRETRLRRPLVGGVGRTTIGLMVVTFLFMIVVVPSVIGTTARGIPHFIGDHLIRRDGPVYSGIWMTTLPEGQAILDAHRKPNGQPPTLWSTYAGLLEARNGLFQPSTDYIIHALGPAGRARYLADFERLRPELVQTVSPVYTQYESWIENTSWDFYSELLRNYKIVGATDWSIFWERLPSADSVTSAPWSRDLDGSTNTVKLPPVPGDSSSLALLEIELDYDIHNPLHVLPVVGAMPRYLVASRNAIQRDPVTLDPYVKQTRFPLIVRGGQSADLQWNTFGLLPGASISVRRIRASLVPVNGNTGAWLNALIKSQTEQMTQ